MMMMIKENKYYIKDAEQRFYKIFFFVYANKQRRMRLYFYIEPYRVKKKNVFSTNALDV